MVNNDLTNQEAVVKALNSSLSETLVDGSKNSPLLEKQSEMNELWNSVNSSLKDKRNKLQQKLTQVSRYRNCYFLIICQQCLS